MKRYNFTLIQTTCSIQLVDTQLQKVLDQVIDSEISISLEDTIKSYSNYILRSKDDKLHFSKQYQKGKGQILNHWNYKENGH